jgi:hypothetical protein
MHMYVYVRRYMKWERTAATELKRKRLQRIGSMLTFCKKSEIKEMREQHTLHVTCKLQCMHICRIQIACYRERALPCSERKRRYGKMSS